MRSVNPQAVVKGVWLNTWFDPPRERGRSDVMNYLVAGVQGKIAG